MRMSHILDFLFCNQIIIYFFKRKNQFTALNSSKSVYWILETIFYENICHVSCYYFDSEFRIDKKIDGRIISMNTDYFLLLTFDCSYYWNDVIHFMPKIISFFFIVFMGKKMHQLSLYDRNVKRDLDVWCNWMLSNWESQIMKKSTQYDGWISIKIK